MKEKPTIPAIAAAFFQDPDPKVAGEAADEEEDLEEDEAEDEEPE